MEAPSTRQNELAPKLDKSSSSTVLLLKFGANSRRQVLIFIGQIQWIPGGCSLLLSAALYCKHSLRYTCTRSKRNWIKIAALRSCANLAGDWHRLPSPPASAIALVASAEEKGLRSAVLCGPRPLSLNISHLHLHISPRYPTLAALPRMIPESPASFPFNFLTLCLSVSFLLIVLRFIPI